MEYIVLDLEWNGPLSRAVMVKEPVRLHNEIIQIGAVKMDGELKEVTGTFNRIIKPEFYRKITKACHEVTLITDDDVAKGVPFREGLADLREWCGDEYAFITWGGADIPVIRENLAVREMDDSWIPEVFDAQIMFDDEVTREDRDYALSYAIWKLGIKPVPAHDALNDSLNTAEVIKMLDGAGWIEEERQYRLEYDDDEYEEGEEG